MKPGIFLLQDNAELVEMNEQTYDSESLLQTLLAKYPALLPLDSIGKYPTILLSTLSDTNSLERFLKVIAWTIEEVKATTN